MLFLSQYRDSLVQRFSRSTGLLHIASVEHTQQDKRWTHQISAKWCWPSVGGQHQTCDYLGTQDTPRIW